MDRRNGGDPLAPPRPPKLLPRVHRQRTPDIPIMSDNSSPIQQRQQHQSSIINQQQNQSNIYFGSGNNNNFRNLLINNSNNSNNNNNNNNNINNSNNTVISHPVPITSPLIPLHPQNQQIQQQQQQNFSSNNLSSSTITPVNSFIRRRQPPSLLQSISLNLSNNTETLVSPVTLAVPRPENERLTNEYVDTPFRNGQQLQLLSRIHHPAGQTNHGQTTTNHNLLLLQQNQRQNHQQQQQQLHSHSNHNQHNSNTIIGETISTTNIGLSESPTILPHSNIISHKNNSNILSSINTRETSTTLSSTTTTTATTTTTTTLSPSAITTTNNLISSIGQIKRQQNQNIQQIIIPIQQPITKQPKCKFTKDTEITHEEIDLPYTGASSIARTEQLNSITCPQCKKCRCEQCQSPRQLPSCWLCNKRCFCSAESIIDYASCLCCVKALFYHCARDHEIECDYDELSCADDPCSCLPHKRTTRWGWLSALSIVLPCLWCYWPLRGCNAICAKCYARHSRHGCRCHLNSNDINNSITTNINTIQHKTGTTTIDDTNNIHNNHNHHHHHHHNSNSGIVGSGGGIKKTLRRCDLTPEKRLLDSCPEY